MAKKITRGGKKEMLPEEAQAISKDLFLAAVGAASLLAEQAVKGFEDLVRRGESVQVGMEKRRHEIGRNVKKGSENIRKAAKEAVRSASRTLKIG